MVRTITPVRTSSSVRGSRPPQRTQRTQPLTGVNPCVTRRLRRMMPATAEVPDRPQGGTPWPACVA